MSIQTTPESEKPEVGQLLPADFVRLVTASGNSRLLPASAIIEFIEEEVSGAVEDIQDDIETARDDAQAAALAAETAADVATTNAGFFEDTAAGLAGTDPDDYFSVPAEDSDTYATLYQNDSNTDAIEVTRFPSLTRMRNLENEQTRERFFRNILAPIGIDIPPDVLVWASPYRDTGYEGEQARPGTGWTFNSQGILIPKSADHSRPYFDPKTGKFMGMLIEPARENLWDVTLESRDLYTAAHEERGLTLGVFTGDGSTDANALNWNNGSDRFSDTEIAAGSIFCRKGTARHIMFGFTGTGGQVHNNISFDFDEGEFSFIGNDVDARAVDLGGGLWWLTVINEAPVQEGRRGLRVRPSNGTSSQSQTLGAGETMIWGAAQLEVGAFPTSPIITEGSSVIRPADTPAIPQVGDRRRGFICWEGVMDFDPDAGGSNADRVYRLPFGASFGLVTQNISVTGANLFRFWSTTTGVESFFSPGTNVAGQTLRCAFWWDADQDICQMSANGNISAVLSAGVAPDAPIVFGQTAANREGRSFTNWIYISYNIPPIDRIEALTRFDGSLIVQGGTP